MRSWELKGQVAGGITQYVLKQKKKLGFRKQLTVVMEKSLNKTREKIRYFFTCD